MLMMMSMTMMMIYDDDDDDDDDEYNDNDGCDSNVVIHAYTHPFDFYCLIDSLNGMQ